MQWYYKFNKLENNILPANKVSKQRFNLDYIPESLAPIYKIKLVAYQSNRNLQITLYVKIGERHRFSPIFKKNFSIFDYTESPYYIENKLEYIVMPSLDNGYQFIRAISNFVHDVNIEYSEEVIAISILKEIKNIIEFLDSRNFHNDHTFEGVHKTVSTQKPDPHTGLRYQAVPGDGHCLFHAVCLYVGQDQAFLRKIVAEHLESNNDLHNFIELTDGKTVENYIDDVRNGVEWAKNVEIEVLMRILDSPIMVVGPDDKIVNPEDANRFNGDPIFVYYNGVDHYDGLLLTDKMSSKQVLEALLTISKDTSQSSMTQSNIHFHTFRPELPSFPGLRELTISSQHDTLIDEICSATNQPTHLRKKLGLFLTSGGNPNQPNNKGLSLFYLIAPYVDASIFCALLVYGANPLLRSSEAFSVLESIKLCLDVDYNFIFEDFDNMILGYEPITFNDYQTKYSIIEKKISKFSFLTPSNNTFTVINYLLSDNNSQLETEFIFSDNFRCRTRLKNTFSLTSVEINEIISIYQEYFKITSKQIYEDIKGNDKAIEIIYGYNLKTNKLDKIIGFNLFQIIQLKDLLFLHIVCAAMKKNERVKKGLMSLLSFRYAYALQAGVFYVAICYDSYRLALPYNHFPKNQTPSSIGITTSLLEKIYGKNNYECTHEAMTYYINEPVQSKEIPDDRRFQDAFYRHYILNILNHDENSFNEERATPVMFDTKNQHNKAAFNKLCTSLNVNAFNLSYELSRYLKILFKQVNEDNELNYKNEFMRARL